MNLPVPWKKIVYLDNVCTLFRDKEEFEDTNEVIRICKSKNRQHNGQKKKDKSIISLKFPHEDMKQKM
jgi:hypothetical protein